FLRRDADDQRLRAAALDGAADAADQRAVADRYHDRGRRRRGLVQDLLRDRAVARELRRLNAVLEERKPGLAREALAFVLGDVEVAPEKPDFRAETLDE